MRKTCANQRGIALVETVMLAVIAALAASLAVPLMAGVACRGEHHAMAAAAEDVYRAMQRYLEDHGRYPTPEEFDPVTLEPLTGAGYLEGADGLTARLVHERVLVYSTPSGDSGADAEFWLLMRHREYPLVFLVARSDSLPGSLAGIWHDGVFVYRGGEFKPLTGRVEG